MRTRDNVVPAGGTQRDEEGALEDVLNIERQAQAVIADAEAEAQRIVSEARRRAQELQSRAQQEAETGAAEAIQTALRYGEQATRTVRAKAEREMAAWEDRARPRIGVVVDWLVRAVTLSEPSQDGTGH